jgi:hypothetical protein
MKPFLSEFGGREEEEKGIGHQEKQQVQAKTNEGEVPLPFAGQAAE